MKTYERLLSAIVLAGFVASANVVADGYVAGYVTASDGSAVTSTSGECVRTTFNDAKDKREACGYKMQRAPAVEKSIEVVTTKTAASVTVKVGQKVVIGAGILFDYDSAELSNEGKAIIVERITSLGHKDNKADVKVIGHTDSTGPEGYNQKLSERRAQNVARYIEQMKQSPDTQVESLGMGESQPLASNDTSEGRTANRRVEITVVGVVAK